MCFTAMNHLLSRKTISITDSIKENEIKLKNRAALQSQDDNMWDKPSVKGFNQMRLRLMHIMGIMFTVPNVPRVPLGMKATAPVRASSKRSVLVNVCKLAVMTKLLILSTVSEIVLIYILQGCLISFFSPSQSQNLTNIRIPLFF